MTEHRCGYVALIGRPNAGKSTLVNRVLGSKLAITSSKPQTTRNRIVGIHTDDTTQVVLVDTPGIHKAWTELNKAMVKHSIDAINDVDLVCWLVDMTSCARRVESEDPIIDAADEQIAQFLESSGTPVVLVANKIDVVPYPLILPVIEAFNDRLPLAAAIPISALTGDGSPELLAIIREKIPVGPPLFDGETWTEATERFLVAEIIREKIFHLTEQEIPYSAAVHIDKFDESEREERGMVRIFATISVERKQQKGIVIGKRGEMLKRIGTLARHEICDLLGSRVYLELFVKVEPNWTRTSKGLRKVGFE